MRVAREILAVLVAPLVGLLLGTATLYFGLVADIIGVVFYRAEDYPYEDAWYRLCVFVGVVVTVGTWWLLRRPRALSR